MSARDEILGRVRAAIAPAEGQESPMVQRDYRTHGDASVDLFVKRLRHYEVLAQRVPRDRVPATIQETLARRGAHRLIAPDGVPDAWLTGLEPLRDDPPLDPHTLDQSDGLLSTCSVAIAETGTIALDGSEGMGRRALSLVPDYHLCVVNVDRIVGTVPEAIARLDALRPITFVSGPSATVDIELVRVGGVHGPRTLEVIISEDDAKPS